MHSTATLNFACLQVVALQLGKHHTATAICCVRLPSSSVTALHHLPGHPPLEKEFVVVASSVTQDSAAQQSSSGSAARGPTQGLLSVFEVCTAGLAGISSSSSPSRSEATSQTKCAMQHFFLHFVVLFVIFCLIHANNAV